MGDFIDDGEAAAPIESKCAISFHRGEVDILFPPCRLGKPLA